MQGILKRNCSFPFKRKNFAPLGFPATVAHICIEVQRLPSHFLFPPKLCHCEKKKKKALKLAGVWGKNAIAGEATQKC